MLALLLSGALAACGKGGATTTVVRTVGVAHAGSGAGEPGERGGSGEAAVRRRAHAYAQAVNLTETDVPGFTPTQPHAHSSASEKALERKMLACAGLAAAGLGSSQALVEEGSKAFELKRGIVDLSVSSEVTVEHSAAQAQHVRAATQSAHVRGCFTRYLQQLFDGQHVPGASAGPVSIQSGTPPAPGTGGGFGWRVTATFDTRGVKIPLYLDILGFVYGPSEVTLMSSSVLRPFPAEAEQHLFTVLLARAKAHTP